VRREVAVAVAVGASLAFVIVGAIGAYTIPVITHAFTGEVSALWCDGCSYNPGSIYMESRSLPDHSSVHLSWQGTSGDVVIFSLVGPGEDAGGGPCEETGISGSCSFVAQGGVYYFMLGQGAQGETFENATFAGTFTAAYL